MRVAWAWAVEEVVTAAAEEGTVSVGAAGTVAAMVVAAAAFAAGPRAAVAEAVWEVAVVASAADSVGCPVANWAEAEFGRG